MDKKEEKLTPTETTKLLNEVVGWIELYNYEEALALLDSLSYDQQTSPEVLHLRWSIAYKQSQFEECKKISALMILSNSENIDSWLLYAQSYYNTKDYQTALNVLQSVESKFKNNWWFAYDSACYYSLTEQYEEATRWLKIAKKLGNAKTVEDMFTEDPDFDLYRKNHPRKS